MTLLVESQTESGLTFVTAKRNVEVVVISDIHLGTYECQAKAILEYLESIQPQILILNGDIIDFWAGKKWTWRHSHTLVIKKILDLAASGTIVYYVIGNHDEGLRKLPHVELGNLNLCNDLILYLDDKRAWFIHGDIFDFVILHAKWLSKLATFWYTILLFMNGVINWLLVLMGKERVSLAQRVRARVKRAVQYISDFERLAAETALAKGYDFVVCGHIHQPAIKRFGARKMDVVYLNSGDWVENLSALEYAHGRWTIFCYHEARPQ
jgi:UDP-2,3-diacylglucosamine pyrophosphatase LpxH